MMEDKSWWNKSNQFSSKDIRNSIRTKYVVTIGGDDYHFNILDDAIDLCVEFPGATMREVRYSLQDNNF